ncbi:MAG: hypothetical protein EBZ77_07700 [Chitinophagia bacterium]|nr:hypothetical protein [Chitinophagia bacterium]
MRKVRIITAILWLLLALVPAFAWAKDKKKDKNKPTHMMLGRWVEVKRLRPDSTEIPFTDTLFMTFELGDKYTYRLRNGFVYRGKYTLSEEGHLEFGTANYEVALNKPKSIVLYNTAGIYYYAVDTSDTAEVIVIGPAEKIDSVSDIEAMVGHWTVYKKNLDKDVGNTDFSYMIKSLYITGKSSDEKMGYIFGGADPLSQPSWYITGLASDQTLECNGKSARYIKVIKCQKGEMILEEAGIMYYAKIYK